MMKLFKILFAASLFGLTFSVLADNISTEATQTTHAPASKGTDTTFTMPSGYKYFRIDCGGHSIKHTRKYTISEDKKLITFVEDDDGWMQFVNEGCMITLYKG